MQKPTLFISYSHEDEEWKNRLIRHLGVLQHQGVLDLWDDRRIGAGEDWHKEIQEAMETASVAILLVSANFLTSDFILGQEVPHLLQSRAEKGIRIFPIILKPCAWQAIGWLRQMQLRPKDARPISNGNENQIDANLAEIALEIYRLVGPAMPSQTREVIGLAPDKISVSRMPVTSGSLFGRSRELKSLDSAWNDPEINIVSLIAWGGVGKSALVNHWLRRLERDNYQGAERVYAWSFYRQGTSERVVSADEFIASALGWFGDSDPNKGAPWEKGERLADLVKAQRTLLVLDGLEPLQFPPGQQEGKLKDQALQALLRELGAYNAGLCVISSRIGVSDLSNFEGSSVLRIDLESLSPQAGAQILKALGVKGEEAELKRAAKEYGGHSLALTLLGSYLSDVYEGDIRRREQVSLEDDVRYGKQAQRVMEAYEEWFGESSPEISVLRLLGLFDRPADERAIGALRAAPAILGLTEALQDLNTAEWRQILAKLRRSKLLAEADPHDPETLDAHPIVREHFGRRLMRQKPDAWREGNNRLYEHFTHVAKQLPDTIQEMEPLFMAVVYGCNAGRHADALHQVYLPRIMRGEQAYAARKLGAYGALLATLSHFFEEREWSRPVAPDLPANQGLTPDDHLVVLTQAGLFLTATKGYASPEVKSCYDRVKELSIQLGQTSRLYSVLISEWRATMVTQELTKTQGLANNIYHLAKKHDDPALLIGAYRALSMTEYWIGNFMLARDHARKGINLWDGSKTLNIVDEVNIPIISCLAVDALVSWHFGNPDQALVRIRQAIDLARELGDMNALAAPALFVCSYINQFCGNQQDTLESAEELIEVSSAQGFALWLSLGKILKGWALAIGGEPLEGITLLKQGRQNFRDNSFRLGVPYFSFLQVEASLKLGHATDVAALIEEGLTSANTLGENWWLAELYRLKGNVVLQTNRTTEAESYFKQALEISRAQRSKSLELRASISLHRLWRIQGKDQEARELLSGVYDSFTEGFQTKDLKEAQLLLGKVP